MPMPTLNPLFLKAFISFSLVCCGFCYNQSRHWDVGNETNARQILRTLIFMV